MNSKTKIGIVDDHPMIIDGIQRLLKGKETFVIKWTAHSLLHLKEQLFDAIDILILDVNVQGMNMLSQVEELKINYPDLKILVFTSYDSPSMIKKAKSKKVDGYLLKDTTREELLKALINIINGESYFRKESSFEESIKDKGLADAFEKKQKLSSREIDVIRLMVIGLDSQEIANELFISLHTVQSHRKNIMRKLNLHSASQVIRFVFEHKLLE